MKMSLRMILGVLAGLGVLLAAACETGPPPTPIPVQLPTVPPPRIVVRPTAVPPTATPTPPSVSDQAAMLALLDRWGLGDPAPAAGVAGQLMKSTQAADFQAVALQRAPVLTMTNGVRTEAAILLATGSGAARLAAFAVATDTDLVSPHSVIWAEHGAAAAILYSWRHAGHIVDAQPFLLVDAQATRRGPVLLVPSTADPPLWAPGGRFLAYVDGRAAGPRLAVVDETGQVRVSGPVATYECARCWPGPRWAPAGERLAYTTSAVLPATTPTAGPLSRLTWRLVALDAVAGRVLFDQQGPAQETGQVVGWLAGDQAQVVVRHTLIPADEITGQPGEWQDTSYVLRLDAQPARLERITP